MPSIGPTGLAIGQAPEVLLVQLKLRDLIKTLIGTSYKWTSASYWWHLLNLTFSVSFSVSVVFTLATASQLLLLSLTAASPTLPLCPLLLPTRHVCPVFVCGGKPPTQEIRWGRCPGVPLGSAFVQCYLCTASGPVRNFLVINNCGHGWHSQSQV